MQISLTPELEALVRRKLESGLYGDASEVVREALRLLSARDELDRLKLERLRAALLAGERSGLVEDFSIDELMVELDEARSEAVGNGYGQGQYIMHAAGRAYVSRAEEQRRRMSRCRSCGSKPSSRWTSLRLTSSAPGPPLPAQRGDK